MRTVHLKQDFLSKTETFVYTQLTQVKRTEAYVLVREVADPGYFVFPPQKVLPIAPEPKNLVKTFTTLEKKLFREMPCYEQNFHRKHLNEIKPDLFHGHFANETAYFLPLIKHYRIPLLVSCYGYDISEYPNRRHGLVKLKLRRLWKASNRVLAMSQDMANDLKKLGCSPEKILIHYHGINLSRFTAVAPKMPSEIVRILFVGRVGTEKKGVEYLVKAFAKILPLRPNVQLHLVGDSDYLPQIEQLVEETGLASKVEFTKFVAHQDLPSVYSSSDIFCHPSVTSANGDKEGIPGSIVEAMAMGLPVVATQHAGIPELVNNGEQGFLVPERDVDKLAEALITLIDNPKLRQQMGQAARQRAFAQGDCIRQTEALEKIYEQVLVETEL